MNDREVRVKALRQEINEAEILLGILKRHLKRAQELIDRDIPEIAPHKSPPSETRLTQNRITRTLP